MWLYSSSAESSLDHLESAPVLLKHWPILTSIFTFIQIITRIHFALREECQTEMFLDTKNLLHINLMCPLEGEIFHLSTLVSFSNFVSLSACLDEHTLLSIMIELKLELKTGSENSNSPDELSNEGIILYFFTIFVLVFRVTVIIIKNVKRWKVYVL